jgi:hypothetical protein
LTTGFSEKRSDTLGQRVYPDRNANGDAYTDGDIHANCASDPNSHGYGNSDCDGNRDAET